jgi:hypothetical protein
MDWTTCILSTNLSGLDPMQKMDTYTAIAHLTMKRLFIIPRWCIFEYFPLSFYSFFTNHFFLDVLYHASPGPLPKPHLNHFTFPFFSFYECMLLSYHFLCSSCISLSLPFLCDFPSPCSACTLHLSVYRFSQETEQ